MGSKKLNRKKLQLIADYEDILRNTIDAYNNVYKTDFELVKFTYDIANIALVEYSEASEEHVFQLGYYYGRASEHFDKRSSEPPRSSFV